MSNPQPSPHREWVHLANDDLLAAQAMAALAPPLWAIACFHAQQAAEKLLKAFLAFHGQRTRRTHDLTLLLTECLALDASLTALPQDCATLSVYAVDPRYPGFTAKLGEQEANDAIAAAERIHAAVLTLLPT